MDVPDKNMRFHILNTEKFKMSRLSLNFIFDADVRMSPTLKLMMSVIMRGSKKYPELSDINRRLDELYGATVTYRATSVGGKHIFKVSCDMISNKYRIDGDDTDVLMGVCELILNVLLDPLRDSDGMLSQKYIDNERKLAIDALKAKINDQKAYSAEQCRRAMLDGHVSAISVDGNEAILSSLTTADITESHRYFLENSAIECYYVGSDNVSPVVEMIDNAFSSVRRAERGACANEEAFLSPRDAENELYEEIECVTQGRLNVGCTCGTVMQDEGYHAMSIFNEMFGGSSVSKLFTNVREKQSLCYYCYSSYNSANGTVMIGCGIKPQNKDLALTEIRNQLCAMQSGEFSDDELLTAKRATLSGLRQIYDSPHAVEAFIFRRSLAGVEESPENCAATIESITREDVIAAANNVKIDTVYFLSGKSVDLDSIGEEETNE